MVASSTEREGLEFSHCSCAVATLIPAVPCRRSKLATVDFDIDILSKRSTQTGKGGWVGGGFVEDREQQNNRTTAKHTHSIQHTTLTRDDRWIHPLEGGRV